MLERMELLLSKDNIDKVVNAKVLIVGIGGVGGAWKGGVRAGRLKAVYSPFRRRKTKRRPCRRQG